MKENEVISANEHFQITLKDGISKIRPKKICGELLKKNLTKKDINSAIKMMACICALDEKIFDRTDIELGFSYQKDEFDSMAGYFSSQDNNGTEGYCLYVPGFFNKFRGQKKHKIVITDSEGNPPKTNYYSWPRVSLAELSIGIAAHEVRHRLQYNNRTRLFTASDSQKPGENYLKSLLWFCRLLEEEEEKRHRQKGRSEYYIGKKINPREFDAAFIETAVRCKVHQGISQEELIKIIKIQPPSD